MKAPPRGETRELFSSALEVVGMFFVTVGAARVSIAAAFIVAGLAMIVIGYQQGAP